MVPARAQAWRKHVAEASSNARILYVINTDHHRGHSLGNQFYLPAPVVAHERAWKEMRGYTDNFKQRVRDSFKKEPDIQVQFNDLQIIRPEITFKKRLTLLRGGREVDGVELVFEQGKVVSAKADKNEAYLISQLDSDPGARYLGEFAVGTNDQIQRFTKNILFDEKIGGTHHVARLRDQFLSVLRER